MASPAVGFSLQVRTFRLLREVLQDATAWVDSPESSNLREVRSFFLESTICSALRRV